MNRPNVILIMAVSADGFITKHEDGLVDWTSKEDKKHFSALTKEFGALIYGNATYKTFNQPLPGRLNVVLTRNPQNYKNQDGVLEFTDAAPKELLKDLADRGYKHAALGGGGKINTLFLQNGLIDEIYLTVEPVLFGNGKRLLADMETEQRLELLDTKQINDNSIVLHYKVLAKEQNS